MDADQALVGTVLNGTYRLQRLIGRGGMGAVFEASHERLPKSYAVKLLRADVLDPEIFERFRREAQIASSLGEEHIAEVHDFNHTEEGKPYMVLEFLEGEDLGARIARVGRLSVEQTVSVVEQACSAMAAAHAKDIVHRDLKPANIFLCKRQDRDDFVKILDFGISKVLTSSTAATRTGLLIGTPNYMAPEQAEGRQADIGPRTDIFSLGVILYECLTGKVAFDSQTVPGIFYQVCHAQPMPIRSYASEVPEGVTRVVERAMAKLPKERYPDVVSLRHELLACIGARPATKTGPLVADWVTSETMVSGKIPTVGTAQTTLTTSASEFLRAPARRSWMPMGIGLALIAAAGMGWWFANRGGTDRASETSASRPAVEPSTPPGASGPQQGAPPGAPPAAASAPAVAHVRLTISSRPAGAVVFREGVDFPLGTTPIELQVPAGTEPLPLVLRKPGFRDQIEQVVPSQSVVLDVALVAVPRAAAPAAAASEGKRKPKAKKAVELPEDL
jgi:serine/threonine-protein kinase